MNAWVEAQLHRHVSFCISLLVLGSGSETIDYKIPPMSFLRYTGLDISGLPKTLEKRGKWLTHLHRFVDIRRRL